MFSCFPVDPLTVDSISNPKLWYMTMARVVPVNVEEVPLSRFPQSCECVRMSACIKFVPKKKRVRGMTVRDNQMCRECCEPVQYETWY